jgi:hypothetical protein
VISWGKTARGRGSEEALSFLLLLGTMGNNVRLAMALKEQQIKVSNGILNERVHFVWL